MMNRFRVEEDIARDTIRYGEILDDQEFIALDGTAVRDLKVKDENGYIYNIVMNNGEYVAFRPY